MQKNFFEGVGARDCLCLWFVFGFWLRFAGCWLVFCGAVLHGLWCASMLVGVTFGDVVKTIGSPPEFFLCLPFRSSRALLGFLSCGLCWCVLSV